MVHYSTRLYFCIIIITKKLHMELIKNLSWRYATKKFDKSKKIKSDDIELLKEAIRLSASSFGLQAYKVLIVEDDELKRELRKVSWDQPQITDCSHLFIFCNYTQFDNEKVDEFINLKANIQTLAINDLKPFGDYLKSKIANLTDNQLNNWTSKQTYIALANLLAAASELKIDSCPMEGFDAARYNEILGLKEKGLNASVIGAIGYRSVDDVTQFATKVRKPKEQLFELL